MDNIIRSYGFNVSVVNQAKLDYFGMAFIKDYRYVAKQMLDNIYKEFILTGKVTDKCVKSKEIIFEDYILKIGYSHIDSRGLKARWLIVIYNQVCGIFKSWLSNLVNFIRKRLSKANLSGEELHRLYKINKTKSWTTVGCPIMKSIFRNTVKFRYKFPDVSEINANLNNNVSSIVESKKSSTFEQWFEIMKPYNSERGKVKIPFVTNKYLDNKSPELSGALQLNYDKDNNLKEIRCIGEIETKYYTPNIDVLSMDFGLRSLFTLVDGSMYGRNFIDKLKVYDSEIQRLTKTLNRNGLIKLSENNKYNKLINKVKNFIKNEINRVLNLIFHRYKPQTIVVEDLNFVDSNLSKQLNRLIRNCGLGAIYKKLINLNEEYGVKIELINSSYTSQECSGCGYISEQNRKGQSKFKCKACGLKLNADVNASRVIEKRFRNKIDLAVFGIYSYGIKRHHYKEYLMNKFLGDTFIQTNIRKCVWIKLDIKV